VLTLQRRLVAALGRAPKTLQDLADTLGADTFAIWQVARRLAITGKIRGEGLEDPATARFTAP
jgi:hypothetical protein